MPIHPRSLSTRLLHTTSLSRARLVNSTTSVSPDLGRAPAPQPPSPVWKPSSARAPHPPPAPTHKGPLRPDPQAQAILDKVGRRAPPPEAPHAARASPSPSPSPAAAPPDRQGELERAVALDLFLLRSLAQLTELEAASTAGPSASPPRSADLRTLLRQHREREGTVLDDTTLSYEPAPGPARRVRIDGGAEPAGAGAGLEGAAGESEQDGTVVVAHVLGGNETRVSICSGFAVGRPVGGGGGEEGQLVLSAAHTLESVRPSLFWRDLLVASSRVLRPVERHSRVVPRLISSLFSLPPRSCRSTSSSPIPQPLPRPSSSPRQGTPTRSRRSPRPPRPPTSSSCASPPPRSTTPLPPPQSPRSAPSPSTPTLPPPSPASPSTRTSTRSRACRASSRASPRASGPAGASPSTRTRRGGRQRSGRMTSWRPCGSTVSRVRGAAGVRWWIARAGAWLASRGVGLCSSPSPFFLPAPYQSPRPPWKRQLRRH